MLLPHRPSRHLQRARRRHVTSELDAQDVHVIDVPSTEAPRPPAQAKPSGRTAALNTRLPGKMR